MPSNLKGIASYHLVLLVAALPCLAILGCGSGGLSSVAGTITSSDGSPLVGVSMMIRSEEGDSGWGRTNEEGHFRLGVAGKGKGVPPGEYRVTILEDRGDPERPNPARLHQKYQSPNSSGLTLTVPCENNTYDLVLDPPPAARSSSRRKRR